MSPCVLPLSVLALQRLRAIRTCLALCFAARSAAPLGCRSGLPRLFYERPRSPPGKTQFPCSGKPSSPTCKSPNVCNRANRQYDPQRLGCVYEGKVEPSEDDYRDRGVIQAYLRTLVQ